jgi:hypothetical protein
MKTICLIISLVMISLCVSAQEAGKGAVVAAVNMNVLYRGMQNPIEIAVPGIPSDKVSVKVSNGTLNKTTEGYSVSPGEQAESVITVMVDNKNVTEKKFRVKEVPSPVAIFAGKSEGQIDKETALKTTRLDVELKDFVWDLHFTIKSFVLLCSDGKNDFEESSADNKVTDKMKSLISDRKTGQYIVFKDIKAIGPDGKSRDLNSIILALK